MTKCWLLLLLALCLLFPLNCENPGPLNGGDGDDDDDDDAYNNSDSANSLSSSHENEDLTSADGSSEGKEEKEEADGEGGDEKEGRVDLLVQKKHIGDIVQLWDESELDGNMRNALRSNSNNRWTTLRDSDGKYYIPYAISGQFTSEQRQTIQRGMDAIDRNTCIRFKPRNSEPDYVDIQNKKDEGCYTTVGRIRGRQVLMLETGWKKSCGVGCTMTFPGCVDHATVVHELMHKVGLWHEQMRFDRDRYIKIRWENIVSGFQSQFSKVNERQSTTYNLPYDFYSVMQYGKSSGAKSRNLVTMETLEKKYQDVIGTAKDASNQDYQKICSIYQCSRCMGRAFTPLRSIIDVNVSNNSSTTGGGGDPLIGSCVLRSDDCDKGIQRGHSLYSLYCCPKCSECEPKKFCTIIDPESQKNLHETFCCGRCRN